MPNVAVILAQAKESNSDTDDVFAFRIIYSLAIDGMMLPWHGMYFMIHLLGSDVSASYSAGYQLRECYDTHSPDYAKHSEGYFVNSKSRRYKMYKPSPVDESSA